MLVHPSNFLLLDEPTNHLDMRAKDVLLEALQGYAGTIVFVSHDRYFLEHLATRVFEVAEGEVRVYPGTYADYLWRKEGGADRAATIGSGPPDLQEAANPDESARPGQKRINPIKLKQMQDEAKQLEERISELESEIQQSELAFSDFAGPEEAQRLANLLEARRAELEQAMADWEDVTVRIETTA
jgi:ATP-binding cassette subfamily F protein 3